MSSSTKIKEMVKDGQQVHFQFYREGELFYRTDSGFVFPVPISDMGSAVFLRDDKALLFMRYIRKHLETLEAGPETGRCQTCGGTNDHVHSFPEHTGMEPEEQCSCGFVRD